MFGVRLEWECSHPSLHLVCQQDPPRTITIPKDDPGEPDVFAMDETACRKLERVIGLIDVPQGHEVLFLLTSESVMIDLEKVQALLYRVDDYVRQCQPTWTNSWAVDFFGGRAGCGIPQGPGGQALF